MSDGKIIIDTKIDSSGAEGGIKKLSSKLGGMAKTGAKAITGLAVAASTVVAGLTAMSVKQYAEYEQLVGGVETLFKDSSSNVMKYANDAYKSAGLSANEYMSTITGFSASLLQGLGGDTKKAAEIGNKAVIDMSDNANKMGTSIESIQNAYQGFAKQNYTMLDNLKLGYGGTKTEMQRLLADAKKLTGIKYDINNFSDVIEAIHVVQNEMGITGTTAKEASSTIEGSLNMTKSAWTNLLTGMADDNANFDVLVDNLVDSMGSLGENLLPRIEIAINGIGQLIDRLLPAIVNKVPELISTMLPSMVNSGINIVSSLGNGILESLPTIIAGASEIMNSLVNGITMLLPMLLEIGLQLIIALGQGLAENLPTLIPQIINLVISICDTIIENLPMLIETAIQIILALVQGLINALPTLIAEVPRIINSFADAIYNALPQIIQMGIQIIVVLAQGLIQAIPTLIANIPQIIMAIINAFTMVNWASIGKNLITSIGKGMGSMFGSIGSIAKNLATNVTNGIKGIFTSGGSIGRNLISFIGNGISSMFGSIVGSAKNIGSSVINTLKSILGWDSAASIGSNLIRGIWNGISNMTGWIINLIGGFAGNVIRSIKDFFDINSPSRIMRDLIGVNIVKGIGVGVDVETPNLEKDIDKNLEDLVYTMQSTVDVETAKTTVAVAAETSRYVNNDNANTDKKNNSVPNVENKHFYVSGKEFMEVLAPYADDVLEAWRDGR